MRHGGGDRRRRAQRLVTTLWLAVLVGCASKKVDPIRVSYESSPALDAAVYRTYAWRSAALERGSEDARDSALLSDWRVRNAVDRQLAAKGYEKRPSGGVDFLVDYSIAVTDKNTQTISDYMNYRDRGGALGPQEAYVFGYQEGSLIIEIVDAKTRELVWRASGTAVANLRDNTVLMERAVGRMLQRFPSASP